MPTRKPDQLETMSAEGPAPTNELEELAEATGVLDEESEEAGTLRGDRQRLAGELAALQTRYDGVARQLRERTAVLNQIQASHGWRLLSVYYRLRNSLIPGRSANRASEAVGLLRDMRLLSSSGLFDKTWYLQRNPDVAAAKVSPLRHYLRRGALEGRDPNPLFDSDWYLQQNPDLAAAGVNPLVHYLRHGANEGRDPSALFDSDWYLEQNPDVAKAGINPLAHYLKSGSAEGRIPRPSFDRDSHLRPPVGSQPGPSQQGVPSHPGVAAPMWNSALVPRPTLRTRPIAGTPRPVQSPGKAGGRRLICVTHVLPYPTRAGNEYRIHRMLQWFEASDVEVFLVVCPLPGSEITPQRIAGACSAYPNLIMCERDGTVLYQLADSDAPVKRLHGVRPRDIDKLLAEKKGAIPVPQRLLPIVHTFCPDFVVEVLSHLDSVLQPDIVLAEYIFTTRALQVVRPDAFKVVDTHDVFSTKHKKVLQFGVEDGLAMSPEEEASLLAPADLVIAIQSEEAAELQKLVPNKPIVTAGIDFDPIKRPRTPVPDPVILVLGSDNQLNVRGLSDFLRFAWPLVLRKVPNAELRVVGTLGLRMETDDASVKVMGLVDDLDVAYGEARVVINPAVAGTGLKIKTVEALCHRCPPVTWPSGVEGIAPGLRDLCYVATNWYMFAQHVIHLCGSEDASEALLRRSDEILNSFSPDTTYAEIKAALNGVHAPAS